MCGSGVPRAVDALLERGHTLGMRRTAQAGALVIVALLVAQAIMSINIDRTAGATAIHYGASVLPNAHWKVVRQTFEPWASDVQRGGFRSTGGMGPAWVVELSAPADSTWKGYSSVVVINALTGATQSASAGASN